MGTDIRHIRWSFLAWATERLQKAAFKPCSPYASPPTLALFHPTPHQWVPQSRADVPSQEGLCPSWFLGLCASPAPLPPRLGTAAAMGMSKHQRTAPSGALLFIPRGTD